MFDPIQVENPTQHMILVIFVAVIIPMTIMVIQSFRNGTKDK
jgi:hypothetical protein